MKRWSKYLLGIVLLAIVLISCGTLKKKKFLDHFANYDHDTLTIFSTDRSDIYLDPATPFEIKGTPIDTSFLDIFSLEDAEEVGYFIRNNVETGPLAYYKIKLNLGYYFLLIRSAGEYWNSRYYGCLYHTGENKVTKTILLAENFGDAGDVFTCYSKLSKTDDSWNIYSEHYFQEPVDYNKYEMDSLYITRVKLWNEISMENDRYFYKEIKLEKNSNKH